MAEKRFNNYAEKRAGGSAVMMYGPGCCGHDIDITGRRIIERQKERCRQRDAKEPKKVQTQEFEDMELEDYDF